MGGAPLTIIAATEKGKTMDNREHPFKIKYKGYNITQYEGWVYVTDRNRREVLRVEIKRPHTAEELRKLFDFNMIVTKGGG